MNQNDRPRQILFPAQLNTLARDLLEGAFPAVWVEGEIGNLSRPASGHIYFSLKDERAQVRCALFKPRSQWLRFRPAEGMRVLVRGRVTLYEARGDYQMILEHMEEAGEGALRRALEELRQRLAAEGLFDADRKRPLPRMPRRIGVLTSPSGAAVRDVLTVLGRRFPLTEVEVLPIPVQGAEAAAQIVGMLRRTYAAARHDVLLLTRGGGSLEDLWCFNDETLARTLAAAPMPVVSAVGHETDTTLADFAADLRAATPSAAAELLVPERGAVLQGLHHARQRMDTAFRRRRDVLAQRCDQAWIRLGAASPGQRLVRGRQRLIDLERRLRLAGGAPARQLGERLRHLAARLAAQHPATRLRQAGGRLDELDRRQRAAWRQRHASAQLALATGLRALQAVSPLATLDRGYALVLDPASGQAIQRIAALAPGKPVTLRLADGEAGATVDELRPFPAEPGPR